LTIGFDPEFADHLQLVDNSKNHTLVQTKLAELGHPHTHVKFIKAEGPARVPVVSATSAPPPPSDAPKPVPPAPPPPSSKSAPPVATSASFNKEDFKNDPLIRKALEVFKGQIVDVRT
jgi:hypothetical protein